MAKETIRGKLNELRKKDGRVEYRDLDSKLTKDIKIKGPQPEVEYIRDLMKIASGPRKKTRHSLIIELLERYITENDLLK